MKRNTFHHFLKFCSHGIKLYMWSFAQYGKGLIEPSILSQYFNRCYKYYFSRYLLFNLIVGIWTINNDYLTSFILSRQNEWSSTFSANVARAVQLGVLSVGKGYNTTIHLVNNRHTYIYLWSKLSVFLICYIQLYIN